MLTMKTYLLPIGITISPGLLLSMIPIVAARPAEGQRELRGLARSPGSRRPPHREPCA
jgi:hypothetical protein